ncbi:MAG: prephenate dehydratase [Alphaproteobacteria bacterium]|mgnify:CR=1 FL=1|jgi:prephenate dehydratase|nr:prephenate dehydratase [Rhodospirillaceae bacterium]MDG2481172.1 prephenate dehydratase [Alphaproteobacteria bacterium]MBT6202455.1 prephenate dehydratase [Rhodospirillaceae bacterium]MBT6512256.1 prephenate dehydratase [Rhodospirillaceae bacterium]MBT7611942.1 prephenate dehydratase [Rhodospirillaceae bacterium]
MTADNTVAFQGKPGAYSHMACREVHPEMDVLACESFEDVFQAVESGDARLAMLPIENSLAGRVADVHHLMPQSSLHIVGEHFQRVNHHLLGVSGATIDGLTAVHSHVQALGQCRVRLRSLGLTPVTHADTAGAARDISQQGEKTQGAIASALAGEIYGLDVLQAGFEDGAHNHTRFLILSRDAQMPDQDSGPLITSMIFHVRSVPAALYKALGGFATNGVNLTKLESYMIDGSFSAAQFYADADGHPDDRLMRLALEELAFFAKEVRVLGTYRAHPYRAEAQKRVAGDD